MSLAIGTLIVFGIGIVIGFITGVVVE